MLAVALARKDFTPLRQRDREHENSALAMALRAFELEHTDACYRYPFMRAREALGCATAMRVIPAALEANDLFAHGGLKPSILPGTMPKRSRAITPAMPPEPLGFFGAGTLLPLLPSDLPPLGAMSSR